jgi:probable F420-dependent oxidoreductase
MTGVTSAAVPAAKASVALGVYSLRTDLASAARIAGAANSDGFSGCWFAETSASALQLCTAAAPAAGVTRLATCVTLAFPRSPMVVAQEAWELARMTQNRFALGLGTQVRTHVERRFSSSFDRPLARLREYVGALRAIFEAFRTGGPLRYRGEFYELSLLPPFFAPEPDPSVTVPILLAGVNPAMAALAGEVADGLVVHPMHSTSYLGERILPVVDDARRGRAGDFEMVVPAFVLPTDDGDSGERMDAARALIAFYGSTPTYQALFDHHGWSGLPERFRGALKAGDTDGAAKLVGDEVLGAFTLRAPWDGVAAAIRARYGGIARTVLPYPVDADIVSGPDRGHWAAVARDLGSPR